MLYRRCAMFADTSMAEAYRSTCYTTKPVDVLTISRVWLVVVGGVATVVQCASNASADSSMLSPDRYRLPHAITNLAALSGY